MILSGLEIANKVAVGKEIVIHPFDATMIGPNSYDLRLADKLVVYEDEILDILVCLQRLNKRIEQAFPEARAFIRPGLD